jgi:carbon-monoxide dehydrogenase small subunit
MNEFSISLCLNGVRQSCVVAANVMLVDLLRDGLGLTGCKVGCDQAVCGACTVLIDGSPVAACTRLAVAADGAEITTIEGVSDAGRLGVVQRAFLQAGALQCGFCASGMILSTVALLARDPTPDDAVIRDWLGGNICRCTGYRQIVDAVRAAAAAWAA